MIQVMGVTGSELAEACRRTGAIFVRLKLMHPWLRNDLRAAGVALALLAGLAMPVRGQDRPAVPPAEQQGLAAQAAA